MAGINIYCENNNFVKLPCSPRAVPWVKNKTRAAKKSIKPTGYIINALDALDFIRTDNLFYLCRNVKKKIKNIHCIFLSKNQGTQATQGGVFYLIDFVKKFKKRKIYLTKSCPGLSKTHFSTQIIFNSWQECRKLKSLLKFLF